MKRPPAVPASVPAHASRAVLRLVVARAAPFPAHDRFVANAAPEVVDGEREKLARYRRELDALGG